jgi:hypothetical protein
MSTIIEVQNYYHLGDQIINFIFFKKIKEYIEQHNIIIHYYCHKQYHSNLLDFKNSDNIIILNWENKGYFLWQGNVPKDYYIEDTLCNMFNIFLKTYNIPISVESFEYADSYLFKIIEDMDNTYKNIDILVINSSPCSGQYNFNKSSWDDFVIKLTRKYKIATTSYINDSILSLHNISLIKIAAIALNVKKIIAINTGPSIPLYNTDILNRVENIYLFCNWYNYKTRKIEVVKNLDEVYCKLMGSKQRQIERWSKLQHHNSINLSCVICNYTDLNENFEKLYSEDIFFAGRLERHKCPQCNLIFGDLRFINLSEEERNNDREDTNSYFEDGDYNINFILHNIIPMDIFQNKNLSYLDYTCGFGKVIPFLKNEGYNICGYEKNIKGPNIINDIENMKFDIIYSYNYIETVINPIEDIQKMLNHLNSNGFIIIISDCLDEHIVDISHFKNYFYKGTSFNILCDKLNLTIVDRKNIDNLVVFVLQN